MKKTVLVSLFVFISFLANAQNWKSHPKKPYSGTDSCLVWQDSTKKFYRIKCSEINTGGSSAIDTLKVFRVEQGRGTAKAFGYFNGVAWVMNDTSYIPRIGADNISGNLLSSQNTVHILGFSNYDNNIIFTRNSSTSLHSKNLTFPSGQSNINMHSADTGSVTLQVISSPFSRSFSVNGGDIKKVFRFNGGLASYTDNYRAQMTSDDIIPDIGKVKQLISDSVGTVQSTTLADGKIWIGDGTDTAFPRTPSGDVTMNNLGVFTIDSINGITKNYYDPTSSIQTQLNSKQATISLTTTGAIGAASYSNPTLNIPKGYDELPTLGVIKSFTGSQWNVTTDWNTTNAGGSFTFGSNKLAMSGTVGTSTYTNYVYISSYISNLDIYSFDEDFTNKSTPSATSYGFSVGIKSFGNQFQTDYSVKVGMSNADVGTLYIISGGSVVATSNGSVGGTLNDTYNLKSHKIKMR